TVLASRRSALLRLEPLKDRTGPSTLPVHNHHDSGAGSLRAATAAPPTGGTSVFGHSPNGPTVAVCPPQPPDTQDPTTQATARGPTASPSAAATPAESSTTSRAKR